MNNKYCKNTLAGRIFDVLNVTILLLFMFVVVYPFWNQLVISLNEGKDANRGGLYFWPRKFTLANYGIIFSDNDLFKGFVISVSRVVVGTCATLFCTGLLSYIVTQRAFTYRMILRRIFVLTMYFGGGMIPVYLLMENLQLTNTFTIYWLPSLFSAYYMLLMSSYIQGLPEAMMEAARIDGANELYIYMKLIIPVSLPVFSAIAVYLAVGHWNSWFDVMIYNYNGEWDTLQVYLRRILLEVEAFQKMENAMKAKQMYENMTAQSVRAATTMVVTVPIVVVYPFFQRYFIGGITLGAVKE